MEQFFNDLKKEGKTDVDSLLKWIKDSNILSKETEDKMRGLFNDTKDQSNVDYAKFREVVAKLATDHKLNLDEVSKVLAEKGPAVLEQLKSGASKVQAAAAEAAKNAK